MSQPSAPRPLEEIADLFARGPSVVEIAAFRLSDTTVARTRELLGKNAAGRLSRHETEELDQLVILDRLVTLIHSKLPQRPQIRSTP